MFRNETRATERKAQKASKKVGCSSRSLGKELGAESSTSRLEERPFRKPPFEMAVIPAIQIPTDTQAQCHFVSNFILLPRQGSTRGFMDYLIPLMKMDPDAAHLQHAFNACALSSLGNRVSADRVDFPEQAFGEYVKALRATNTAIKDPRTSTSDALLAAVLLLSMFEVSLLPVTSPPDSIVGLADFPRTSPQVRTASTHGAHMLTVRFNS